MAPNTQTHLRSLEAVDGKVIPYEVFCKCRQEAEPNADFIRKRREQLTAHYTRPGETPKERAAILVEHYTQPEI